MDLVINTFLSNAKQAVPTKYGSVPGPKFTEECTYNTRQLYRCFKTVNFQKE